MNTRNPFYCSMLKLMPHAKRAWLGGLALVVSCLIVGHSGGADLDPKLERFILRGLRRKEGALAKVSSDLETARERLPLARRGAVGDRTAFDVTSGAYTFATVEDRQQTVDRYESQLRDLPAEIERIKREPFLIPKIDAFEMQVGDIGFLDYGSYVIGATPMTFRVQQVLGPQEMLIKTGKSLAVVRGVSTTGLVDGSSVTLSQVMEVAGTHSYETVGGGTNTVFVVSPFDVEILKTLAIAAEKAAADTAAKEAEAERQRLAREEAKLWRTWTSADGQFTVEAKLRSFAMGRATLEKRDGSTIDVTPGQLSEHDQQYIRDELKRRR